MFSSSDSNFQIFLTLLVLPAIRCIQGSLFFDKILLLKGDKFRLELTKSLPAILGYEFFKEELPHFKNVILCHNIGV